MENQDLGIKLVKRVKFICVNASKHEDRLIVKCHRSVLETVTTEVHTLQQVGRPWHARYENFYHNNTSLRTNDLKI